ncbi:unnamed protein product, partial [Mesorhabditis spiculigera]
MDLDRKIAVYRLIGYLAVALATASTISICITIPILYTQVARARERSHEELDFCQHSIISVSSQLRRIDDAGGNRNRTVRHAYATVPPPPSATDPNARSAVPKAHVVLQELQDDRVAQVVLVSKANPETRENPRQNANFRPLHHALNVMPVLQVMTVHPGPRVNRGLRVVLVPVGRLGMPGSMGYRERLVLQELRVNLARQEHLVKTRWGISRSLAGLGQLVSSG